MSINELKEIHPLLTDRVRLMVMATLAAAAEPVEFVTLVSLLEVSHGNLSSHLRKLEEGGLIEVYREFVDRKPKSTYACSKSGKREVKKYFSAIESALRVFGK